MYDDLNITTVEMKEYNKNRFDITNVSILDYHFIIIFTLLFRVESLIH